jgi:hypothetical protein
MIVYMLWHCLAECVVAPVVSCGVVPLIHLQWRSVSRGTRLPRGCDKVEIESNPRAVPDWRGDIRRRLLLEH